jgi:DNA modification methylase
VDVQTRKGEKMNADILMQDGPLVIGSGVQQRRKPANTLNDLSSSEWLQRTKSVMFQKGLGANHEETKYEHRHPCPFSYQDAERLITFFTKCGQKVIDPFSGIASTLKASALTGRIGTGIELSPEYCGWGTERLSEEVPTEQLMAYPQQVINGDARDVIQTLPDNEYDFLLSSPPYWRILSKTPDKKAKINPALRNGTLAYSDDARDFGCIADYDNFIQEMASFILSCRRVLKPNAYLAIIVADFRDGPTLYPYSADLLTAIRQQPQPDKALVLQGIKILAQNRKRLYPYGYPTAYVPNIHHHYILIYRCVASKASRNTSRNTSR